MGRSRNGDAATLRASWTKLGPLSVDSSGTPCSSPFLHLPALVGFYMKVNFLYPSSPIYFDIQKPWVDTFGGSSDDKGVFLSPLNEITQFSKSHTTLLIENYASPRIQGEHAW